jgi:hypothetical protein
MKRTVTKKHMIGRAEYVSFPEIDVIDIPARIDTGAKTSALWATGIRQEDNGELSFFLFDKTSPHHRPVRHSVREYDRIVVKSTIGEAEERYKVRLLMKLDGRVIRASFTLANRSQQVYPVLIGRNVLKGKFVVDVELGEPRLEKQKAEELRQQEETKRKAAA